MILKTFLRAFGLALSAATLLAMNTGCKKGERKDNFVHVDVYGQAGARYSPILENRFLHFSRERSRLPSGHKIMVSSVMEEVFENQLADPAYRGKAQVLVLDSEQQASADPNLAAEFSNARQGCSEKLPCYLLVPNSVTGEQREAALQFVDYAASQAQPAPDAAKQPEQPTPTSPEPAATTPAPQ
jgi:hypothetical protein